MKVSLVSIDGSAWVFIDNVKIILMDQYDFLKEVTPHQ